MQLFGRGYADDRRNADADKTLMLEVSTVSVCN